MNVDIEKYILISGFFSPFEVKIVGNLCLIRRFFLIFARVREPRSGEKEKPLVTWISLSCRRKGQDLPGSDVFQRLSLTEHQRKALLAVINRKDVFAILPTGHGKSIIFQLLPDVCKYLFKADRLQMMVVAKKYIPVLQLFISRMPKMCAIPQLSLSGYSYTLILPLFWLCVLWSLWWTLIFANCETLAFQQPVWAVKTSMIWEQFAQRNLFLCIRKSRVLLTERLQNEINLVGVFSALFIAGNTLLTSVKRSSDTTLQPLAWVVIRTTSRGWGYPV